MEAVFAAFLLTLVAEMGDKTQFMVMAFAGKFGLKPVLLGMTAGVFASMAFAVVVGSLIGSLIPAGVMQLVAGFTFIAFGLWSLRGGDDDEEEGRKGKLSPFWTVFTAIFIGEMGDKTQLTAAVLAADAASPVLTWLGSAAGMIVADGLGVVVGAAVGKRIPQRVMKWAAALIFLVFGSVTLGRAVPAPLRTLPVFIAFLGVLVLAVWAIVRRPRARQAQPDSSPATGE